MRVLLSLLLALLFLPLYSFGQGISPTSNIASWPTNELCNYVNDPREGPRVRAELISRGAPCVARGDKSPPYSYGQGISPTSNIASWPTNELCNYVNDPREGPRVRTELTSRGAPCVAQEEKSNSVLSNWIVDEVSGCVAHNPFPKRGESIRWYGQCVNTYVSGYGKLEWYDNGTLASFRQGYYELGYSEGYGFTVYVNKKYFIQHEGNSKSSKWNGQGTLIYSDNTKYVGMFLDGKRSGQGVLYDVNGKVIQSGLWLENKFSGNDGPQAARPGNSGGDVNGQQRKKCIRLGLQPNTEDFRLCLKSGVASN